MLFSFILYIYVLERGGGWITCKKLCDRISGPLTQYTHDLFFFFFLLYLLYTYFITISYSTLFYSLSNPLSAFPPLRENMARTGATKTYDSSLFLSFFYYGNMCYPGYSGVILIFIVYAFEERGVGILGEGKGRVGWCLGLGGLVVGFGCWVWLID